MDLLNKGLKFCLPRSNPPVDQLVVDIMASIEQFTDEVKDEINETALRTVKKL